jgi:hypothetical protein
MPAMQNATPTRAEILQQVQDAVQAAQNAQVAAAQAGKAGGTPKAPTAPTAPVAMQPIPVGGGRLIIDKRGDQTIITSAAMPPELLPLAKMAQDTAMGFMGILALIFIAGPFARVLARRMDRRTEINAAGANTHALQSQLLQLQQSVDSMAVEVERISESQRFQSKLLNEGRQNPPSAR